MKVSHGEGVASHTGPESCKGVRKGVVEALTGERAGWVWSPEILMVRDADALMSGGRPRRARRKREAAPSVREPRAGLAGSKTPCTHRSISLGRRSLPRGGRPLHDGSREIPRPVWAVAQARAVNLRRERRR